MLIFRKRWRLRTTMGLIVIGRARDGIPAKAAGSGAGLSAEAC